MQVLRVFDQILTILDSKMLANWRMLIASIAIASVAVLTARAAPAAPVAEAELVKTLDEIKEGFGTLHLAPKSDSDGIETTKETILKMLDVFSTPIVGRVMDKRPNFRRARDELKALNRVCIKNRDMCKRNIHEIDVFIGFEENLGRRESNLMCYLKQCRKEQQVFCDSIQ